MFFHPVPYTKLLVMTGNAQEKDTYIIQGVIPLIAAKMFFWLWGQYRNLQTCCISAADYNI